MSFIVKSGMALDQKTQLTSHINRKYEYIAYIYIFPNYAHVHTCTAEESAYLYRHVSYMSTQTYAKQLS